MKQIPIPMPTDADRAYNSALDMAMYALRFIAMNHPVCPRCFLEMLDEQIRMLLDDENLGPAHTHTEEGEANVYSPAQGHA